MAQWQRKIDLQPEWDAADNGEITIASLAGVVAERLQAVSPLPFAGPEEERKDLVAEFLDLAADPTAGRNDFDDVMERLYDWGDTPLDHSWNGRKVCFVSTFAHGTYAREESAA